LAPVKNFPDFAGSDQFSSLPFAVEQRCRLNPVASLLSFEKQAKVSPMGHNKGRDNARKRAKRRKKTERLASAKKKQKPAK